MSKIPVKKCLFYCLFQLFLGLTKCKISKYIINFSPITWFFVLLVVKIINIFTAKIFRIILNGKTLLYSGLSWIFWLRSDGLRIASKIMPRTFWSKTQSNNAQSVNEEFHSAKSGNLGLRHWTNLHEFTRHCSNLCILRNTNMHVRQNKFVIHSNKS